MFGPILRSRAADYVRTYHTNWQKTSLGFTVNGHWAFERYTYKSTDTDRKTGAITTDVGKGINIFRRGSDGKWRVAVDGGVPTNLLYEPQPGQAALKTFWNRRVLERHAR
jgi:ketosteroid isomerase-like protein